MSATEKKSTDSLAEAAEATGWTGVYCGQTFDGGGEGAHGFYAGGGYQVA